MEVKSKWISKYKFVADNGQGHEIDFDLPPKYGGEGSASAPVVVIMMSLASCLGSAFKMIADKMHLEVDSIVVKNNFQLSETSEVKEVHLVLEVKTKAPEKKILVAFDKAEEICPVGNLLKASKVSMDAKVVLI